MIFRERTILCPGRTFILNRKLGDFPSTRFFGIYAENTESTEQAINRLSEDGPDAQRLASLLSKFGDEKSLRDGRLLHGYVIRESIDSTHGLYNNRLLRMYAKCGAHHDAYALFSRMQHKDSHSWRFMIRAFATSGSTSHALQLFQQMMMEGCLPFKASIISILSAFTSHIYIDHGVRIHASIVCSELESDLEVGNTIINMYNRCNSLLAALDFFSIMQCRNVVSFNTMIAASVQHDNSHLALDLFQKMTLQAIVPNEVTFISIVMACIAANRLSLGMQMHVNVCNSELTTQLVLGNAFLNMYGKCGSFDYGRNFLYQMPNKEVATWNCMITTCIQHEQHYEAFYFYHQMQVEGVHPNNITNSNILSVCASQNSLELGKRLHSCLGSKCESDFILGTALVDMYGKCLSLEHAATVFRKMENCDVILWNAMIDVHVKCGEFKEALKLFEEMDSKGLIPTKVTFVNLLDAMVNTLEYKDVQKIISHYKLDNDILIGTSLMNIYKKCGDQDNVYIIFDKMLEHDLFAWNAYLAACGRYGADSRALFSFQNMLSQGILPDKISFVSFCGVCGRLFLRKEGIKVHTYIAANSLETEPQISNSLINMYGKFGDVYVSKRLFDAVIERDDVTWNSIIAAYSQIGWTKDALQVFQQMQMESLIPDKFCFVNLLSGFTCIDTVKEGKQIHTMLLGSGLELDGLVANSIMNMYGKCGDFRDVKMTFDMYANHDDTITWNGMLAAYVHYENGTDAILLFQRMLQQSALPDKVTFISLISVCTNLTILDKGKETHVRVLEGEYKQDLVLANTLVNMYGKSSSIEDALAVFDGMNEHDVVSWNAIITAYAIHGYGQESLCLYNQMQKDTIPNKVTCLMVLFACSHAGLLEEGIYFFWSMNQKGEFVPDDDHCNCVIDLLGRAGLLKEGEAFIGSFLPDHNALAWTTLLGFCRLHCDEERGERVARNALSVEPQNNAIYLLLSNMYASSTDTTFM